MASDLYTDYVDAQDVVSAPVTIGTADIRAILVRTTGTASGPYYSVSLADDKWLSDIPSNTDCQPIAAVTMTNEAFSARVFDADDVVFPSVPSSSDAIQAIVIYKHTGTPSTSRLMAFLDSAAISGLPVTPNGQNINLTWDNGANKIWKR